ncbi:DNA polymerase III subunit delta' [Corynebacterium lipophiloflavum]|uniref:DNA polymerase III, delta' subunit n=1 Tax=Corynebacterium lipophiloflavum (strain ATCC 700352 / DSM 44291 / CCUG 37336 / JCM 10383 / DMMZ 1944) TaxID=525263 RepID=C0XU93_CORLD|nr:DNA polymerase III subunit delta' [Corynebacterium lipophiloflavum]EEI16159.1 putative DNA polymerase III, delta' subunit [Corynebacterium lipophiloflavum DSM 44291]
MTRASVSERLADIPRVRETILRAAEAARGAGESYAMSHAWLFTGPPGAGRSTTAVAFAAALVCTDPDVVGCGRCDNCRAVFAGAHTDVVHIVPKELVISVETVRGIVNQASRLPTVGAWRVIIIDEADRFSTAAADAFLKTVEEPPASTVIILSAPSTDPEDFSTMLRSRCRHLYVPAPSESEIVRLLTQEEGASEEVARLAAAASLRHIGRARRLVRESGAQTHRAQVINLAELVFHGDAAFKAVGALVAAADKEAVAAHAEADSEERAALERALGMGAKGKGAAKALRGVASSVKQLETQQKARGTRRTRDVLDLALVDLAGIYRDALVLASGARVGLTHPDFEGLSREIAERVSVEGLVACQDAIARCRQSLDQNVTPVIAFNGMIGRIRQACNVK